MSESTISLTPGNIKLLRLIAAEDTGAGVEFRYLSRGRYILRSGHGDAVNRGTFYPLDRHKLIDAGSHDDAPVRITAAGRDYLAQLDATAKPKTPRSKPTAESPAALRLLKAIGALENPVLVYKLPRRIWRLGRDSSVTASVDTWMALRRDELISMDMSGAVGQVVRITQAGRQRLDRD